MKVRIVECLVVTEMTRVGEKFVEYYDNTGYFYPLRDDYFPNGVGMPFDTEHFSNWLKSGKIKVLEEIEHTETAWFKINSENLSLEESDLNDQLAKINNRLIELHELLSVK